MVGEATMTALRSSVGMKENALAALARAGVEPSIVGAKSA